MRTGNISFRSVPMKCVTNKDLVNIVGLCEVFIVVISSESLNIANSDIVALLASQPE